LDGNQGLDLALHDDVDLVVLDLMLPERSGMDVLAALRESKPALPVIVLTARGEIEDRVAGLDAGAVDYLVKPFSLSELAARIRAQLRVAAQTPGTTLAAAGIDINLLSREVHRSEQLVRLSTTEFELLVYLMRNRGRVVSREQILRAVWGYGYDPGTNVVDVYIGYLRRKLGDGDKTPIVTVRSVGYIFDGD
jgi:DNA-binding response OmpR family regulator